jgi:hypothetical protein
MFICRCDIIDQSERTKGVPAALQEENEEHLSGFSLHENMELELEG